ncbi:MAG: sugar nucleotide-binding protein [Idiomarina sp.]|nr:sugar nucleotide-binding protein [Idiomarina sp.]
MNKQALWVGFGDIGERTASQLQALGYELTGARRSRVEKFDGVTRVQADAASQSDWGTLLAERPDLIIFSLTPTSYSAAGYEQGYVQPVRAFRAALSHSPDYRPQLVFISSTSVYGNVGGELISEADAPAPGNFSGSTMLEAEQMIASADCPFLILRCSGIYGPGRERMIDAIRTYSVKLTQGWTNRIHVTDLSRALVHLVSAKEQGVYILSDNEPVRQSDFVRWLAERMRCDLSRFESSTEIGARGSKRLSNQRLLDTGFRFEYPNFRLGYTELLKPTPTD